MCGDTEGKRSIKEIEKYGIFPLLFVSLYLCHSGPRHDSAKCDLQVCHCLQAKGDDNTWTAFEKVDLSKFTMLKTFAGCISDTLGSSSSVLASHMDLHSEKNSEFNIPSLKSDAYVHLLGLAKGFCDDLVAKASGVWPFLLARFRALPQVKRLSGFLVATVNRAAIGSASREGFAGLRAGTFDSGGGAFQTQ